MVSRIRTWLMAGMERLWSQLAPRREAGEFARAGYRCHPTGSRCVTPPCGSRREARRARS
jgi:hypothetical protein